MSSRTMIEIEFRELDGQTILYLNKSPLQQRVNEPFVLISSEEQREANIRAIEHGELGKAERIAFGQALYQALTPGSIADAMRLAREGGAQVVLQLRFNADTIKWAALPWELIHNGQAHALFNGEMEIVRYINLAGAAATPFEVASPLRVLQVVASPSNQLPLDVGRTLEPLNKERRKIEGGQLHVETLREPTYDLAEERLNEAPKLDVFHFDGHGVFKEGENLLYFESEESQADPINAELLQAALSRKVSLVVLNACNSSKITAEMNVANSFVMALLAAGVPALIGMQFSPTDDAAVAFVKAFYRAMCKSTSLIAAMTATRRALRRKEGWYMPTLYYLASEESSEPSTPKRDEQKPPPPAPPVAVTPTSPKPTPPVVPVVPPPVEESLLFFAESKLHTWPHPIAAACAKVNGAQTERERFVGLDGLLNNVVKYLTAIALSHYWQDEPDKEGKATLRGWLAGLSQARLMTSLTILDDVSAHYATGQEEKYLHSVLFEPYTRRVDHAPQIVSAYGALRKLNPQQSMRYEEISCQSFLGQWLRVRELKWESNISQVDHALEQRLLPLLLPALQELLAHFDSLFRYPLRFIEKISQADSEWVYCTIEFPGVEGKAVATPVFYRESGTQKPTCREKRLYLCVPQGRPLLCIHPFLIENVNVHKLYFLEKASEREEVWYQHCASAERYQAPLFRDSHMPTWLKAGDKAVPGLAEGVPEAADDDPVQDIEQVNDELDKSRALKPPQLTSLPIWLSIHLSDEGREALAISLGEALRIGHFWLGLEFLLMGLSKQRNKSLPRLLHEMGISTGKFRGIMRGQVGVLSEDWRQQDVFTLGMAQLQQLQEADAEQLRADFNANQPPAPILTPRMKTILQEAAHLAGERQIGHNELLAAACRHPHSWAMQLLFSVARQAEWRSRQVLKRLQKLAALTPDELANEGPLPNVGRREKRGPQHASPPELGGTDAPAGLLAEFGRDLIQAAKEGQLNPAQGEAARQAITQMARILLKQEGNNPLLIGEPGVGKTAVVEGLAWRLAGQGKEVIAPLANKRIIELTTAALLSGTKYRGDLEARLRRLLAEVKAEQGQTIVFIDEIHSILAGGASGGLSTIADAIKPALARGEFPCIGATTVVEYRRHIEKDKALARRFTTVWLEQPSIEEAINIVKNVATHRLAKHHGVTFAAGTIETAVRLSHRYLHEERLPGSAIKVLDEASTASFIPDTISALSKEGKGQGTVEVRAVQEVIAQRTNIPLERLAKTDYEQLIELERTLKRRIMGQDDVITQVTRVLKRAGAGLADPRRPMGVFLFAGPTGVGKTELALALANALFGHRDAILRLDMSEFMEKHQVARLIGAPPGYIGHENEGQLTAHLRRHPYTIVLLDEIEKAHQDVQHLFLQLFEDGRLTDSQGRLADGRSAIFIMTSNLGAKEALGFASLQASYEDKLNTAINLHFTPEFINRLDRILYFAPLNEDALLTIFDLEFAFFAKRLHNEQRVEVIVNPDYKRQIAQQIAQQQLGARPLRRYIEDKIVSQVVDDILAGKIQPGTKIMIDLPRRPDTDKLLAQIAPASPKVDFPQSAGGFSLPAAQAKGPQRPILPKDGLPHLDNVDEQQQEAFDKCFLALAERLQEQAIALSINSFTKKRFCSPLYADWRGERPPVEAFKGLIEEPLIDKMLKKEFQAGDWILVDMHFEDVVFKKNGGSQA